MTMALHPRHDHGGGSSTMGDMSDDDMMSMGTIDVHHFPRIYWAFVGAVIAAFAVRNVVEYLGCRQRLAAARDNKPDPARPKNIFVAAYATLTAVAREVSNASPSSFSVKGYTVRAPRVGSLGLVLAYLALLLVLCFYQFNTADFFSYEQIAFRAGFVSLGQIPLIFLLAGKNNVIGCVTGYSYERLNWLHRWTARGLLVTVTIHLGYWFSDWAPYGNYIQVELTTYKTASTGFACWIILLWIVLSSFAPIRGFSYEVFVVQHVVSFVAFITMVFLHTPMEDWAWLWAAVAIYFADRVSRALWMLYTNLAIFHTRKTPESSASGLWSCNAELEPLPHGMTRITVKHPPISWTAGQHALVSCNTVVPLQSHPFSISSIPQDNRMEFVVKAQAGGTKRLLRYAEKMSALPTSNGQPRTVPLVIQGPFGKMRPLRQFDSVVLIAGSTGATFTTPLLRDLVAQMGNDSKGGLFRLAPGAVTRHIRYVWAVKSRQQLALFADELKQAVSDVNALSKSGKQVSLDLSVYITCDPSFTQDTMTSASPDLQQAQTREKMQQIYEEQKTIKSTTVEVQELDPRASDDKQLGAKTCGPDGTCCCQTPVVNESDQDNISPVFVCTCNNSGSSAKSESSADDASSLEHSDESSSSEKEQSLYPSEKKTATEMVKSVTSESDAAIKLLSGRPHPRNLVRHVLEQARGESAVVVCGPQSLNDGVRQAVVALSDERAVHKGTGAQGIWFWSEGFGW